jgi:phage regulator Rha-like protein
MSSVEIAELTGKRHDHVMVDIRKMLIKLDLHATEFSGDYKDSKGRTYPCFNLPKRETLILVSGYNIQMRARIIDRWQELEAEKAVPSNTSSRDVAEYFEKEHRHMLRDIRNLIEKEPSLGLHNFVEGGTHAQKSAVGLHNFVQAASNFGRFENNLLPQIWGSEWTVTPRVIGSVGPFIDQLPHESSISSLMSLRKTSTSALALVSYTRHPHEPVVKLIKLTGVYSIGCFEEYGSGSDGGPPCLTK